METKMIYMCPNCSDTIEVEFNIVSPVKIVNHGIMQYFDAKCCSCNEHVEYFQCDEKMLDIIKLLNRNKIVTNYCCEGHIETIIEDDIMYITNFSIPYFSYYVEDGCYYYKEQDKSEENKRHIALAKFIDSETIFSFKEPDEITDAFSFYNRKYQADLNDIMFMVTEYNDCADELKNELSLDIYTKIANINKERNQELEHLFGKLEEFFKKEENNG